VRVVLDTNILVRANPKVSPQGLARELLETIVSGPHVLVLSPAILLEVQRVLSYPHVQARWPLAVEAIEKYLILLESAGFLVELPEVFSAVVSDPDDDPILQTAIAGRADVLCTRDEAFRHEVVERVCAARGIRILDDVALMRELRRSSRT
jgi:putative PIN family toxin of toxin-antitoxin system